MCGVELKWSRCSHGCRESKRIILAVACGRRVGCLGIPNQGNARRQSSDERTLQYRGFSPQIRNWSAMSCGAGVRDHASKHLKLLRDKGRLLICRTPQERRSFIPLSRLAEGPAALCTLSERLTANW